MEDEYRPTYVNTLPGATDMSTPIAKSMPVTQASQMPVLPNVPPYEQDIMKPISSEQARSTYMERHTGYELGLVTFEHTVIRR